jgi:sugar phosphate isomerase/epimerase
MKPAFSTVACSDWTLPRIAERAAAWGYLGCELRTFGHASTQFACDPALSSSSKVRGLFERAGVQLATLATSARFDEPITMPQQIIGDTEKSVRELKGCVDLAIALEIPYVRVFAFEEHAGVSHNTTVATIAERLFKAVDYARNSGVRILLENGGSFETAAKLAELVDRVHEPGLGVCYNAAVAEAAGESAPNGINVLGERIVTVKIQDLRAGLPCALGEGELNPKDVVASLAASAFKGWITFEYNRAWFSGSEEPEAVLSRSAKTLYSWIAGHQHAGTKAKAVVGGRVGL